MTASVRVFTTGRSRALRIPLADHFDGEEVTVDRDGDRLILAPTRACRCRHWLDHVAVERGSAA